MNTNNKGLQLIIKKDRRVHSNKKEKNEYQKIQRE